MEELKQVCVSCGEEKVIEEFPADRRAKTGYKKVCKECFNEKYKDRNNKTYNIEEILPNYIKEYNNTLYKALSIQAIAEEKDFMEVLIESIKPKDEFILIARNYESEGS